MIARAPNLPTQIPEELPQGRDKTINEMCSQSGNAVVTIEPPKAAEVIQSKKCKIDCNYLEFREIANLAKSIISANSPFHGGNTGSNPVGDAKTSRPVN